MTIKAQVILPERSMDSVSENLRQLTRQICLKTGDDGSGGLGGEYGYGSNFENSVFSMNRYCWCEKENCKLCNGEEPNFFYKPSDTCISWYKYIGRGQELSGSLPDDWLEKCIESIWKKDDCWIETNRNYGGQKSIILCFSPFDGNTLVEINLDEFNPLSTVLCWSANTFFNVLVEPEYDQNKYNKVKELREKYPNMDKKINKMATEYNKKMIKWHRNMINDIKGKLQV